ncbi:MAG: VOC family protein [Undibacterium sp.]
MLDHVSIHVADLEVAKMFYLAALEPLGYGVVMELPEWKVIGLGVGGKADFWILADGTSKGVHIAFKAENRKAVDDFYAAAITAGGKDNGKPGLRPEYHVDYYGAFVHDPDGNNIEAVTRKPE